MAWFGLVKDIGWHKKAIDALSVDVDYERIIEINKSLDALFITYFIDSKKATELVLEKEKIFAVIELQNDWIYSVFSNAFKELKKPKIRVKITASGKNPDKLFSILAETGRYPSKFKEFLNVRNHNSREIIAYLKKSDGVQAKLLHQKMKPSEKAIMKHKQFVLNVRQELIDVISKVERYYGSYSLAQRAVAFSAAIAISLAVYAVDVDGRGVRLGVSGVEAGEVVKDVDEALRTKLGASAELFQEMIKNKPYHDELAVSVEFLVENKKYAEVIVKLDEFKEQTISSSLLNNLGISYIWVKNVNEGLRLLHKAFEIDPNDISVLYNLGGVYGYVLGNKEEGIKFFQMYIRAGGPSTKKANDNIRRLGGKN